MSENKFNNLFWRISAVFFVLMALTGLSYVFITVHYSSRYFQDGGAIYDEVVVTGKETDPISVILSGN